MMAKSFRKEIGRKVCFAATGCRKSVPFEVRLTNSAPGEERSYECRMHTYSDSASLLVDREFTHTG